MNSESEGLVMSLIHNNGQEMIVVIGSHIRKPEELSVSLAKATQGQETNTPNSNCKLDDLTLFYFSIKYHRPNLIFLEN